MSSRLGVRVALLALCCLLVSGCGKSGGETPAPGDAPAEPQFRNPFGLEHDITDCCVSALDEWADGAPAYGTDDDENAEQWHDGQAIQFTKFPKAVG